MNQLTQQMIDQFTGIVEMDRYNTVLYSNQMARDFLHNGKSMENKGFSRCLHNRLLAVQLKHRSNIIEQRMSIERGGKKHYLQYSVFFDDYSAVFLFRDITDFILNEMNLKKSVRASGSVPEQEQISSGEHLLDIVANISHELKTPVNVISTAAQMIGKFHEYEAEYREKKYVVMIERNCHRLTKMINNLVDISRCEKGDFAMRKEFCNLVRLTREVCDQTEIFAESKHVKIHVETGSKYIMSCVDRDKFERILINLLTNAIKFSEPDPDSGEREIIVSIQSTGHEIILSVQDFGIGIPPEDQERIFERFVQAEQELSRRYEGSGMGLAITKNLVELHGGTITVHSKPGEGSTFVVTLPAQMPESDQSNMQVQQDTAKYRADISELVKQELSDIIK